MKTNLFLLVIGLQVVGLLPNLRAQSFPSDLDFEDSSIASMPAPGHWFTGRPRASYEILLDTVNPYHGKHCVTIRSVGTPADTESGGIYQSFDATPYRGKSLQYRAGVRRIAGKNPEIRIQMVLLGSNGEFLGSVRSEISIKSEIWQVYELTSPTIDKRVARVSIGCFMHGVGAMAFDDVKLGDISVGEAQLAYARDHGVQYQAYTLADGTTRSIVTSQIKGFTIVNGQSAIILSNGQELPISGTGQPWETMRW